MTQADRAGRIIRWAALALGVILGAYWAGSRWGPRQPERVEALATERQAASTVGLTDEESINVRVYREASPAVANIVTRAVEYDFFMEAVPVEGAGSGFVIDPRGERLRSRGRRNSRRNHHTHLFRR